MALLPNSWQTPNEFMDVYNPHLTAEEWRVLSYACRHILGWHDKIDSRMRRMSISMFENGFGQYPGCGLRRAAIIRALDGLSKYGLLQKDGQPTRDGQMWRIPLYESEIDLAGLEARTASRKTFAVSRTNQARNQRLAVSRTDQQRLVPLTGTGLSDRPNQRQVKKQVQIQDNTLLASDDAVADSEELFHSLFEENGDANTNTPITPPVPPSPASPRVVDFRQVKKHYKGAEAGWEGEYVYIGREMGSMDLPRSPYANTHAIGKTKTAEQVVNEFREDILADPDLLLRLDDLRGKTLVCWCKHPPNSGAYDPNPPCHGDVLIELLDLPLDKLQELIVKAEAGREKEIGSKEDAAAATAIIKAWLDGAMVVEPTAYGNKTKRGEALALHQRGVTPVMIGEYVAWKRKDKFWESRAITWHMIKGEMLSYLTNRARVQGTRNPASRTPEQPTVMKYYEDIPEEFHGKQYTYRDGKYVLL